MVFCLRFIDDLESWDVFLKFEGSQGVGQSLFGVSLGQAGYGQWVVSISGYGQWAVSASYCFCQDWYYVPSLYLNDYMVY
jgi:hypothetical protein